MRESRVWAWLSATRPSWLSMERMEPMYPPGLADCFWVDRRVPPARAGWLELKYCEPEDKSYRAGRLPKIRPEQLQFLRRQAASGLPAGILLRVDSERWYVWRAMANHEWINIMQTPRALALATRVFLMQPEVREIIDILLTAP